MNPGFDLAPPVTAPGIFAGYRPPPGVYDELKDAAGCIRPHWLSFVEKIEALGVNALRERHENAQQLLRDHGVTFNVYADGRSAERPWKLDILPFLISAQEWSRLEAGLIQRAQLLDLVLADLYGSQRLLHDGLLSPALVHANPGFIRPCHGIAPVGGRSLSLYAVDLTRSPNGEWWVLSDRSQAPSGVGYALESRIIVSRVSPEEFRTSNVQRVASFFLARKAGLRAMVQWTDSPHIVLLTPGPLTSTYFEHAYLARYLGYPLVEGSDLTVRDRRVFIKTLEGLQRVDVIIRRLDDTFCDPLELRTDSFLGVPGLVEAARAGNVAISNSLGSGAVEAPALLAFLPALARHLLGEELRIPNVATWWCGQQRERAYMFGNLSALVVKRAFVRGRGETIFARQLNGAALQALAARIRGHPSDFVGQEQVALSTAPVWNGERIEPRPLILRCFIAKGPDGYTVFPGGLTRVSASADSPVVTSEHGGGSKDTWVITEQPVQEITLIEKYVAPAEHLRSAAMVPSRVLDNLFWLGRYSERLENNTRLLRTVLARVAGEGGPVEEAQLAAMIRILTMIEQFPPNFSPRIGRGDLFVELFALVFEKERPGSLRELLDRIGFLTASLRDRFSGDTWRILHQLQAGFPPAPQHFTAGAVLGTLHRLIFQLAAFSGMEMENMTRGFAWRFLEIGRRLERASNLLETVRAVIATEPRGASALVPLLEYSDSTMTYRRRYFALPELPGTLDLLLADPTNPRAVAFQFAALAAQLAELPDSDGERRQFSEIHATLKTADWWALGIAARDGSAQRLDELLGSLIANCWSVSDSLTIHYFSHALPKVS